MVNSFNEWHEDTQIEPLRPAAPTSKDNSGKQSYTEGHRYCGYGDVYLDILSRATRRTSAEAAPNARSPVNKGKR